MVSTSHPPPMVGRITASAEPFFNLHSHEHECRDGKGSRQLSEA